MELSTDEKLTSLKLSEPWSMNDSQLDDNNSNMIDGAGENSDPLKCAESLLEADVKPIIVGVNAGLEEKSDIEREAGPDIKPSGLKQCSNDHDSALSPRLDYPPIEILPDDVILEQQGFRPESMAKLFAAKRQIDFDQPQSRGVSKQIKLEQEPALNPGASSLGSRENLQSGSDVVEIPSWKRQHPRNVQNARQKLDEKLGELIYEVEKRVQLNENKRELISQARDMMQAGTSEDEMDEFEQFSEESDDDSDSDWSLSTESSMRSRDTPTADILNTLGPNHKQTTTEAKSRTPLYGFAKNRERCIVGYLDDDFQERWTKPIDIDRLVEITGTNKEKAELQVDDGAEKSETKDTSMAVASVDHSCDIGRSSSETIVFECKTEPNNENKGITDTGHTQENDQPDVLPCLIPYTKSEIILEGNGRLEDSDMPELKLEIKDVRTDPTSDTLPAKGTLNRVSNGFSGNSDGVSDTVRDLDLEKFEIDGSPLKKKQSAFESSTLDDYLKEFGGNVQSQSKLWSGELCPKETGGTRLTNPTYSTEEPDFEEIEGIPFFCFDSAEKLAGHPSPAIAGGKKTGDVTRVKGWKSNYNVTQSIEKVDKESNNSGDMTKCKQARIMLKKIDIEDLSRLGLHCDKISDSEKDYGKSLPGRVEVYQPRSMVKSVKVLATEAEQPKQGKIYGRTGFGRFASKSNVMQSVKGKNLNQSGRRNSVKQFTENDGQSSVNGVTAGTKKKKVKLTMPYLNKQWVMDALKALQVPNKKGSKASPKAIERRAKSLERNVTVIHLESTDENSSLENDQESALENGEQNDVKTSEKLNVDHDSQTNKSPVSQEAVTKRMGVNNQLKPLMEEGGEVAKSCYTGSGKKWMLMDGVLHNDPEDSRIRLCQIPDPVYEYDPDNSPYQTPRPARTRSKSRRLHASQGPGTEDVDPPACGMNHCRLGCVCDSLKNSSPKKVVHCGKIDCVLGCHCNYRFKISKTHDMLDKEISAEDGLIELRDGLKRSRRLQDKTTVMWNNLKASAAKDECIEIDLTSDHEEESLANIDIEALLNEDEDNDTVTSCARTSVYVPVRLRHHNTNTAPTYKSSTSDGPCDSQADAGSEQTGEGSQVVTDEEKEQINNEEATATTASARLSRKGITEELQKHAVVKPSRPFRTQMVLLQRKKGESNDVPHLLEIKSNCDWDFARSSILGKVSMLAEDNAYPEPCVLAVANLFVAILPKPKQPTRIPKHLQAVLKTTLMYAIFLKITEIQSTDTIDLTESFVSANKDSCPSMVTGMSGLSSLHGNLPGMKKTRTGGFEFVKLSAENAKSQSSAMKPIAQAGGSGGSVNQLQIQSRRVANSDEMRENMIERQRNVSTVEGAVTNNSPVRTASGKFSPEVIVVEDDSDTEETMDLDVTNMQTVLPQSQSVGAVPRTQTVNVNSQKKSNLAISESPLKPKSNCAVSLLPPDPTSNSIISVASPNPKLNSAISLLPPDPTSVASPELKSNSAVSLLPPDSTSNSIISVPSPESNSAVSLLPPDQKLKSAISLLPPDQKLISAISVRPDQDSNSAISLIPPDLTSNSAISVLPQDPKLISVISTKAVLLPDLSNCSTKSESLSSKPRPAMAQSAALSKNKGVSFLPSVVISKPKTSSAGEALSDTVTISRTNIQTNSAGTGVGKETCEKTLSGPPTAHKEIQGYQEKFRQNRCIVYIPNNALLSNVSSLNQSPSQPRQISTKLIPSKASAIVKTGQTTPSVMTGSGSKILIPLKDFVGSVKDPKKLIFMPNKDSSSSTIASSLITTSCASNLSPSSSATNISPASSASLLFPTSGARTILTTSGVLGSRTSPRNQSQPYLLPVVHSSGGVARCAAPVRAPLNNPSITRAQLNKPGITYIKVNSNQVKTQTCNSKSLLRYSTGIPQNTTTSTVTTTAGVPNKEILVESSQGDLTHDYEKSTVTTSDLPKEVLQTSGNILSEKGRPKRKKKSSRESSQKTTSSKSKKGQFKSASASDEINRNVSGVTSTGDNVTPQVTEGIHLQVALQNQNPQTASANQFSPLQSKLAGSLGMGKTSGATQISPLRSELKGSSGMGKTGQSVFPSSLPKSLLQDVSVLQSGNMVSPEGSIVDEKNGVVKMVLPGGNSSQIKGTPEKQSISDRNFESFLKDGAEKSIHYNPRLVRIMKNTKVESKEMKTEREQKQRQWDDNVVLDESDGTLKRGNGDILIDYKMSCSDDNAVLKESDGTLKNVDILTEYKMSCSDIKERQEEDGKARQSMKKASTERDQIPEDSVISEGSSGSLTNNVGTSPIRDSDMEGSKEWEGEVGGANKNVETVCTREAVTKKSEVLNCRETPTDETVDDKVILKNKTLNVTVSIKVNSEKDSKVDNGTHCSTDEKCTMREETTGVEKIVADLVDRKELTKLTDSRLLNVGNVHGTTGTGQTSPDTEIVTMETVHSDISGVGIIKDLRGTLKMSSNKPESQTTGLDLIHKVVIEGCEKEKDKGELEQQESSVAKVESISPEVSTASPVSRKRKADATFYLNDNPTLDHLKNPSLEPAKPLRRATTCYTYIEKSKEEDDVDIDQAPCGVRFARNAATLLKEQILENTEKLLGTNEQNPCTSFKKRKQGLQQRWPVTHDSSMVFTEEVFVVKKSRSGHTEEITVSSSDAAFDINSGTITRQRRPVNYAEPHLGNPAVDKVKQNSETSRHHTHMQDIPYVPIKTKNSNVGKQSSESDAVESSTLQGEEKEGRRSKRHSEMHNKRERQRRHDMAHNVHRLWVAITTDKDLLEKFRRGCISKLRVITQGCFYIGYLKKENIRLELELKLEKQRQLQLKENLKTLKEIIRMERQGITGDEETMEAEVSS